MAGELGQGALGFHEPGAAGVQGLLRLLHALRVARLLRLGQLAFQPGDGAADLVHRAPGARQRLRVGAPPLGVLRLAHRILDPAQPRLEPLVCLPRHRAGLLPAFLDAPQGGARGADIGHRDEFPGLLEQLGLDVGVLTQRGVLRRVHLRPGTEEGVLRDLEPVPQLVLVRPGCPARRLPGPHQFTEGGGGGGPVGGVGEGLRLGAQALLARLCLVALLGQFGEVGLAALVEGIASRGQPFPQRGLHRTVGSRRGLPFLQQLPQPLAAVLPVRRLGRDGFGLDDDGFLDALGLGAHLVTRCADLFLALIDLPGQRLKPGVKLAEVADRVRVGHRGQQPIDPRAGLRGRQIGGGDPLLEQADLRVQRGELALVEGKRLLGAAGLPRPDHPLTLGGAHVNRAVGVHPAPRIVGAGHREPPAQTWTQVTGVSGLSNSDTFDGDLLLRMAITVAVAVVCACLGHILDDSQSTDDLAEGRVARRQR
jgi:hypothetical protein